MSQRKEKYARRMERRVDDLEDRADFTREELIYCGSRLTAIEEAAERRNIIDAHDRTLQANQEIRTRRKNGSQRWKLERTVVSLWIMCLAVAALAVAALILSITAVTCGVGQAGGHAVEPQNVPGRAEVVLAATGTQESEPGT